MASRKDDLSHAGRVTEIDGVFRAHVQYRGENNRKANLYGPRRLEASEAKADLASMRAAAAVFPNDRVSAFQSMHAEARRIQIRVEHEKDREVAKIRRIASVETDSEDDGDGDLLIEEPDAWFEELQEGRITIEEVGKVEVKPRRPITTPTEATEELMKTFQPLRESVEELKRLLDLRADPNALVPAGLVSPLQNVMAFTPEESIEAMRDLLLKYGAVESKEDAERWAISRDCALREHARIRAFYEDDRHLSFCAAIMERDAYV